jgi:hypothetical protein
MTRPWSAAADPRAQKPPPRRAASAAATPLVAYADETGDERELVVLVHDGCQLVIDRTVADRSDPRLVGEFEADEPDKNAMMLALDYLGRAPQERRCAQYVPAVDRPSSVLSGLLRDRDRNTYWLQRVARFGPGADLRWVCRTIGAGAPAVVTLRTVVGALEVYEPPVSMTRDALAAHHDAAGAMLRRELAHLGDSRFVLNRGLREAVAAELARGTPLAEIARRCGHTRTRGRGITLGDGAWVARRVGLTPDGKPTPSRWIDQSVLREIAAALGLPPAEVRL